MRALRRSLISVSEEAKSTIEPKYGPLTMSPFHMPRTTLTTLGTLWETMRFCSIDCENYLEWNHSTFYPYEWTVMKIKHAHVDATALHVRLKRLWIRTFLGLDEIE